MPEPKPTLFIIDGSNNFYRSYYAIRGLTNSSGLSTNAVYGFTQMLRKLLKEQKPDAIAVAFDIGGTSFRKESFTDYKKDRKPMPDDLSVQVPLIYELLEGFRIPIVARKDYEADDLIGSLACTARDRGYRVVIATSDKDFFQVVGNGIELYHTGRDVLYDEKGATEAFGLDPTKVVDVMGIWGDAIDNIPGVPGIGEKGAKSLITDFGSLEGVYENLDKLKPAQRKKLEEFRDQAFLSRDLARIRCDMDVEVDFSQLAVREPDRPRLHDLFARLEFHSLMQEYLPERPPTVREYRAVQTVEDLQAFLKAAGDASIAFHAESADPEKLAADYLALARSEGQAIAVDLAQLRAAAEELLRSDRLFVTHDLKAEMRRLDASNLPVPRRVDDTMIMSYVLNPGAYSHTLESLCRERLKVDVQSRKDLAKQGALFDLSETCIDFIAEKPDFALALHRLLAPDIAADEALKKICETIEMPLIPVLARMEKKGIRIDVALLREMSATMGSQLAELETKIYKEAGEEFNINSPTQLATILFDKLQYPALKKTQKTKSASTGVEVLKELAGYGYAVPQLILEHRELHKLKSTYVDALPQLVAADGRVHTSFNQAVAATGRLSSSDPNLQNIPIRTALGREIRRAFIADEGNVLLTADYSQIELRILAHMSGDESLIEAFQRGVDIHKATAAKIFNVAEPFVTPDQRRASKTINFGVLYGMSAFRLSQDLGISNAEGKEFIDSYFARYPRVREFLDRTLAEARATGKVTTLFGRVRHIPEIHNRSWTVRGNAERMATNAPIQGTAADLLKLAMIELERRLRAESPRAEMLLTVHDEIVMEVPEAEVGQTRELVRETMERIYPMAVPLAVETGWGRSWYEAKD